ncbi:MAG TPA: HD domain-containing phosphohydrolase, partial [Acidobacteriota bacterium]|nr:HD domain-containing phosphohydrolase [Acidobacteriota bacterium]
MSFTNSALLRRYRDVFETESFPRVEAREGTGSLREIVVAEGDASELEHVASILRALKFSVLEARDGQTALRLAQQHSPLMVLSSLELPGLDGYRLSQRLKESKETEGIPFMFIVEPGQLPDRIVGHQTYAHDYIQKPISIPDFKSRINSLVNLTRGSSSEQGGRTAEEGGQFFDSTVPRPQAETRVGDLGKQPNAMSLRDENPASIGDLVEELKSLMREFENCLGTLERSLADGSSGVAGDDRWPSGRSDRVRQQFSQVRGLPTMERNNEPTDEGRMGQQERKGEVTDESRKPLELVTDPTAVTGAEVSRTSVETDGRQASDSLERYRAEFQKRHRNEETGLAEGQVRANGLDSLFELFLGPRSGRVARPEPQEESLSPDGLGRLNSEAFSAEVVEETLASPISGEIRSRQQVEGDLDQQRFQAVETRSQPAQQLYSRAVASVLEWIKGAESRSLPRLDSGWTLAADIVGALEYDSALLLAATDRFQEFSVSAHSVNVAILSVRFADTMGRASRFKERICLAALLHEIGVVRLPEGLMFKKDPLSAEALQLLRSRPVLSAEVLQALGEPSGDLAEIVGQVFERANGSGSPLGRKGNEIREEAGIVGIVDAFETCIHSRPYRQAFTGYQTLQEFSTD